MAKRFTDTDKWKDPWFNELPTKAKITWIYLCDNCDYAGIWKADFKLLAYYLGEKITENEFQKWFAGRALKVKNDYFIRSFYEFQYGSSADNFRAKQSALKRIQKLGLLDENNQFLDTPQTVNEQSTDCLSILEYSNSTSISNTSFEKEGVGEKTFNDVICLWNEHSGRLPKVEVTNKARETRSAAILKKHSTNEIINAIKKLAGSDFCNGLNDKSWVADFDFFVRESTYAKIIEGKYDNRKSLSQKDIHNIKKTQELVEWVNDDKKGGVLEF